MAWFLNRYECARCGHRWRDCWSCMCDDDCPHCGARHMSPIDSDDLTEVYVQRGNSLVLYRSPRTAEHRPDYEEVTTLIVPAEFEGWFERSAGGA